MATADTPGLDMSAAITTPAATAETGAGVGTITSGPRLAAVPGLAMDIHRPAVESIRHPVAGGIHQVRHMAAAGAGTVAAGTAAAGTAAVELHRFPVTRVDAAAIAARINQPRAE
jgi:hypothetical protein